jgi:hypothetical protein
MATTGVSYDKMTEMVRSLTKLVGNVPFSNDNIFEFTRASLGEVFAVMGDLHDRYWSMVGLCSGAAGTLFVLPKGCTRVLTITEATGLDSALAGWREASLLEVLDRQAESDPPHLWAYGPGDGNISVTKSLITAPKVAYIKDPSFERPQGADLINLPQALIGAVLYKTAAKIEAKGNMERAQGLLADAAQTTQAFIQTQISAEGKSFARRKDYVRGQKTKQVVTTEF